MDFEDALVVSQIDQTLAESVELGYIHTVEKTPDGDNLYSLTAKGITNCALLLVSGMIAKADHECRDFSSEEKAIIREHLQRVLSSFE